MAAFRSAYYPKVVIDLVRSFDLGIIPHWCSLLSARRSWKRVLEAWDQDHVDHPGPFARFKLIGADVYWPAAITAGAGEVDVGKKALDEHHYVDFSSLLLNGADLTSAPSF